jgi:hypothetical protein
MARGSAGKRARAMPLEDVGGTPIRRRQSETATPRGATGVTDTSRDGVTDEAAMTQQRVAAFKSAAEDTEQQQLMAPLLLAWEQAPSGALAAAAGVTPIVANGSAVHEAIASAVAAADSGTENNAMLAAVGLVANGECLSVLLKLLVEMREMRGAMTALSAAVTDAPARVASSSPIAIGAAFDKKLREFFTIEFLLNYPLATMTPANILVLSAQSRCALSLSEVCVVPKAPQKVVRAIFIHRFCFV